MNDHEKLSAFIFNELIPETQKILRKRADPQSAPPLKKRGGKVIKHGLYSRYAATGKRR